MGDSIYCYRGDQVFRRRGDRLVVQRVAVQDVCPPHEHEFIEIVLVAGGSGVQETAARHLKLRRGNLTILRPGRWHAYTDCRRLSLYNCCFGPELLKRELCWLLDDPLLAKLLWGVGSEGGDPVVTKLSDPSLASLRRILDSLEQGHAESRAVKISRLGLFLSTLSDCLSPDAVSERLPIQVTRGVGLIESELARPWRLRELATACGCSPEYLIRLFRASIGMTPYAYLDRCRAERASALLMRSDAAVAEVGGEVGWPEPCHFARRFKKHHGMSASEYRRRMQY